MNRILAVPLVAGAACVIAGAALLGLAALLIAVGVLALLAAADLRE